MKNGQHVIAILDEVDTQGDVITTEAYLKGFHNHNIIPVSDTMGKIEPDNIIGKVTAFETEGNKLLATIELQSDKGLNVEDAFVYRIAGRTLKARKLMVDGRIINFIDAFRLDYVARIPAYLDVYSSMSAKKVEVSFSSLCLEIIEDLNSRTFTALDSAAKESDVDMDMDMDMATPFSLRGNEFWTEIMFGEHRVFDSESFTEDVSNEALTVKEQIKGLIAHELLTLRAVIDAALTF